MVFTAQTAAVWSIIGLRSNAFVQIDEPVTTTILNPTKFTALQPTCVLPLAALTADADNETALSLALLKSPMNEVSTVCK